MDENFGNVVEDAIEHFCSRTFFADYVFRSPKYVKANGEQKEAADFIIFFEDTLIAIQAKSKGFENFTGEPTAVEQARIRNRLEKTEKQFHATAEALSTGDLSSFINSRGQRVPFDKTKIQNIVLVVIFAPFWKTPSDIPINFRFENTCFAEGPIPIHYFSLQQFTLLLTLLDTMSDFSLYLDAKWLLHREKLIAPNSDPIDIWALITFRREEFLAAIDSQSFMEITGLYESCENELKQLEQKEKLSYLIDDLIESLHHAVGLDNSYEPKFRTHARLLAEPGSIEAHRLLIPYLARLNRQERLSLAQQLIIRQNRCNETALSFGGLKFPKREEGYFVLASKSDRRLRPVEAYNLGRAFGFKIKVKAVICITSGPLGSEPHSYELMYMDLSAQTMGPELTTIMNQAFTDPYLSPNI